MFALLLDARHRILLASFSGTLDGETVWRLDDVVARLVERTGPLHAIGDFTAVDKVGLLPDAIVNRGLQPPLMPEHHRVFVVPRDELYGLARMYATYQRATGNPEPILVRSIAEAYRFLNLVEPDFQPIDAS